MTALPLRQATLGALADRGVRVPTYDRGRVVPRIVHVGVGGFVRSHLARYTDAALERGGDWGIAGLALRREDARICDVLARQDHLYALVERGAGAPSCSVVGSFVDVRHAPPEHDAAVAQLIAAPTTAILSLTVTESGYGEPSEAAGPTTFDRLASALRVRRDAGAGPLTILSLDNLPGNGGVARGATLAAAARLADDLPDWVDASCTFPDSMVDRITPATTDADRAWLRSAFELEDEWPVVAEPFSRWVLEDDFAAGRPAWEHEGVLFTGDVRAWELYKLRLLNAAHSALAYLAALAGIRFVDEAMRTPAVRAFVERLLLAEAVPTLEPIPGHPPEAYVDEVLARFESTGIRDQVQRLCVDGSAKLPAFLLPTLLAQLDRDGPIAGATTALAGWARYLAVVPPGEQASDAHGDAARGHALRATADPLAFLDFAAVLPPGLRDAPRFRTAFADAYARVAVDGPLAACAAVAHEHREATG